MLRILRQYGLIALNTFHDKHSHAYSHAGVKSQLDYVFAKGNQTTGLCKKARGPCDFPLLAARGEGSHVPIAAQIPRNWRIWKYGQGPGRGPNNEAPMHLLQQNQRILVTHVHQALQQPLASLADIDQVLLAAQENATRVMTDTVSASQRAWQDEDLRGILRSAWNHLRQARSHRARNLDTKFRAWRHAGQFLRPIRSTRELCRILRRQKPLAILNDIRYASHKQDMAGVFKIVDRIAPKRNRTRPQFRNNKGGILDIQEEASANASFMRKLYLTTGPEHHAPPEQSLPKGPSGQPERHPS